MKSPFIKQQIENMAILQDPKSRALLRHASNSSVMLYKELWVFHKIPLQPQVNNLIVACRWKRQLHNTNLQTQIKQWLRNNNDIPNHSWKPWRKQANCKEIINWTNLFGNDNKSHLVKLTKYLVKSTKCFGGLYKIKQYQINLVNVTKRFFAV